MGIRIEKLRHITAVGVHVNLIQIICFELALITSFIACTFDFQIGN